MAALARQVSRWPRPVALPRARAPGAPSRPPAASPRALASAPDAPDGAGPAPPRVEPERAAGLARPRLGGRGACVGPGPAAPDRAARALRDMGFGEDQAAQLLGLLGPGGRPQQLLDVASELTLLGVRPAPVCAALKANPPLLRLPAARMRSRCAHLRRLGLGEGKMKRVLLCCPDILTMHQRDLEAILEVLRDKCLFTVQQVTEILHRCPYVLREDPDELEYKFQYAYFRMGVAHADIVRSGFLQYSMTKIKQRHTFLERLGRYQTPDKKGQTQIPNPLIKNILRVSEAEFLARTACSSAEEFDVFKKLLAREEEEPEGRMPKDRSDSLDEDEEDVEEGQ